LDSNAKAVMRPQPAASAVCDTTSQRSSERTANALHISALPELGAAARRAVNALGDEGESGNMQGQTVHVDGGRLPLKYRYT
jgi:hypothetical protein